jgi:hypothetical protein
MWVLKGLVPVLESNINAKPHATHVPQGARANDTTAPEHGCRLGADYFQERGAHLVLRSSAEKGWSHTPLERRSVSRDRLSSQVSGEPLAWARAAGSIAPVPTPCSSTHARTYAYTSRTRWQASLRDRACPHTPFLHLCRIHMNTHAGTSAFISRTQRQASACSTHFLGRWPKIAQRAWEARRSPRWCTTHAEGTVDGNDNDNDNGNGNDNHSHLAGPAGG